MNLTLKQYIDGVQSGKLNPSEIIKYYFDKAQKLNSEYFSFIRFHEDYILDNTSNFSSRPLHGVPIGIKDIILTKNYISSCGSHMLKNYISPYSATCFLNLEKNGGLMIGKTNMDEFAMGGSTENSYFGITKNNHGVDRVPGGSSGGSAVAVASDSCIAALGTDTGGSVRQPASFCGIVGLKPTYGRVSRYGVQSMASSLDQVGTFTKTVEDARILLSSIAGFDPQDSQSDKRADNIDFLDYSDPKNFKIGLPTEVLGEGLDPKVKSKFLETIEKLKSEGFQIDEISIPPLTYSVPMYYTLMPAEVSTNLARLDGIKFGLQEDTTNFDTMMDYYSKIRSSGFGDEAKRRILLGTFVLSSANYEGYYIKAQKARDQLKSDFDKIYSSYDIIIMPTVPEVAWKIGERSDDPLKMYLADMYTIPANMGGLPAISVPIGTIEDRGEDMPVGIQLMANTWQEKKIFDLGEWIEKNN
ncbi:Asp-tRNA(Asn)/Glu-tRNA(Gln) amidotransferase subunit GatA [Candidatus Gracilibacteria bacterium]|nr:Asp-tRNA(Asn)/Glu-tRNA(Gln) amidotransferase subunit GatA [Candidatus Gracilibacteria bacterium]